MDTHSIRSDAQDERDWLYARAHSFPLLDAARERSIDGAKWAALGRIQQCLLVDPAARQFLAQWADNLIAHKPNASVLVDRDHARLLMRECADYLPGKRHRKVLCKLRDALAGAGDPARLLAELELPAALVAGMAELLAGSLRPASLGAALATWRDGWPGSAAAPVQDSTRKIMLRALRDYAAARDQLVNHNLRLVFSVVARHDTRFVPYRDLVQEGMFGLIRAAEKFQCERGYRFSTYAYSWINQAVLRALADQSGIVRLPSGVGEQVRRLYRERMEHLSRSGEEPDTAHLAARLGLPEENVERLRGVGNLGVSLDGGDDDEGPGLGDTLAGGPFPDPDTSTQRTMLRRALAQHLEQLSPAERTVVLRRWGMDDSLPLTRAEIATHIGVSVERVRQLEGMALDKLRRDPAIRSLYCDQALTAD